MALDTQLSDAAANAACNALAALANGGSIKIYTASKPANANIAVSGQTLLATLPLNNPAFGSAAAGIAALNTSGVSVTAVATGTAAWFRVCNSGGSALWDGTIGTSGCNINLASTAIQQNATVTISSYTLTVNEAGQ